MVLTASKSQIETQLYYIVLLLIYNMTYVTQNKYGINYFFFF